VTTRAKYVCVRVCSTTVLRKRTYVRVCVYVYNNNPNQLFIRLRLPFHPFRPLTTVLPVTRPAKLYLSLSTPTTTLIYIYMYMHIRVTHATPHPAAYICVTLYIGIYSTIVYHTHIGNGIVYNVYLWCVLYIGLPSHTYIHSPVTISPRRIHAWWTTLATTDNMHYPLLDVWNSRDVRSPLFFFFILHTHSYVHIRAV